MQVGGIAAATRVHGQPPFGSNVNVYIMGE